MTPSPANTIPSGPDVRIQLPREQGDLILEQQLALLHALQGKLVVQRVFDEAVDSEVEVAVLELELSQPCLDSLPQLFVQFRHESILAPAEGPCE